MNFPSVQSASSSLYTRAYRSANAVTKGLRTGDELRNHKPMPAQTAPTRDHAGGPKPAEHSKGPHLIPLPGQQIIRPETKPMPAQTVGGPLPGLGLFNGSNPLPAQGVFNSNDPRPMTHALKQETFAKQEAAIDFAA